jgi:cell division protein ZapA
LKKRFNIKVMEQEFSVLSDEEDAHVAKVVRYVNDKAREIERSTKNQTTLKLSILVALNIADEYLKLESEKDDIYNQLEKKSERLIHFIEEGK